MIIVLITLERDCVNLDRLDREIIPLKCVLGNIVQSGRLLGTK